MSLTLRLALAYLLVTLVGMALFGVGVLMLATSYVESRRLDELNTQADLYAGFLSELAVDAGQAQQLLATPAGRDLLPSDVQPRLFSTGGVLLAGASDLGPFPSRPVLSLVQSPFPLPASQVEQRAYVARNLPSSGEPFAVLELSQSTVVDTQLLSNLRGVILQATLVAVLLIALVSLGVARSIVGPLSRLTERADALAATVIDQDSMRRVAPVPIRPRDELVRLSVSLDRLSNGLQSYLARIDDLERTRTSFYRSVSHELRTPLTAIRATLENLVDTAPDSQREALLSLEAEALRLERLVNDLLRPSDDGRLTSTAGSVFDMGELVETVCGLLEGRATRSGVSLQRSISGSALVFADRDRFKQVLINLLDNALRVSPAGGTIEVAVALRADQVQVCVSDEGPGIPAELHERVWERGIRGDDQRTAGSSGLGLAIVREIVQSHGGSVVIDPEYRTGTRMVVELPGSNDR